MMTYSLIILAALWGLSITYRISKEKKSGQPMVCPLGADCKKVVTSEFSSFLGIGLEAYGAIYYVVTIVGYTFLLLFLPNIPPDTVVFLLTGFTIVAFLFSVYLTIVQAFYLRSWCTWCLCSACASTVIFLLTIFALIVSAVEIMPLLVWLQKPILILHLLGFALGVGGATISDILFLKFLKDFQISEEEDKILRTMSQIVWVGLLIVIISGVGLFIPNSAELLGSSKFLVKMTAVLIIIINGSFLNLILSPRILRLDLNTGIEVKKAHMMRKIAFALGGISFVSWYIAFILGVLKHVDLTYFELISFYGLCLIFAIVASQIGERLYCTRSTKKS